MSKKRFWFIYSVLAVCQIVLCNYFNFSPLVSVSLLPAMVMCIPVTTRTPWAMVIAFVTGLVVDFTADGVPGLNALALVPVALCRSGLVKLIIGDDVNDDRTEPISFKGKGFGKVSWVNLIAAMIFFAVYITVDGAGTRPLGVDAVRFAASTAASYLLSLLVVPAFSPSGKV